MEEKTLEERIYIFYKKLDNKLSFYKRVAIENIQKDIKNDKILAKKDEYLELLNSFYSLFENEIKKENSKIIEKQIEDTFVLDDQEIELEY